MAGLPFRTHLRLPLEDLSGQIQVILKPLPEAGLALDADDCAGAISLLKLFEQGLNAQLFSGKEGEPVGLEIAQLDWNARDKQVEMQALARHVPAYAWFHLLAMLQKNHDALEPLMSVTVSAGEGGFAELAWEAVRDRVPREFAASPTPFLFDECGGVDKSRNLNIDLEFEDEMSGDLVQKVTDDLSVWMQMLILGAFDGELLPTDDIDPLGEVAQISSIRMQCLVPFYRGDMSGFAALEHLLRSQHRRAALAEVMLT